jgi:hypothetical protein
LEQVKRGYSADLLWVLCVVVAAGIGWLLVRRGATPNGRVAVEQALRQAKPTDVESMTVYPLVPGQGPGPARPFQVREPAQLRHLLPALQQLRPIASMGSTFEPLLEATLVVRLAAQPAEAWQLHSRNIVFRLATSSQGEVAQLAQTNYFYNAAALSRQLGHLRDSLAHR